jgi:hypothetical protein
MRRHAADRHRALIERMHRHGEMLNIWNGKALQVISNTVRGVGEDFARRGLSDFVFVQRLIFRSGEVDFEVRLSGIVNPEAWLTFQMDLEGVVHADTGARGAQLPEAVAVSEVTSQWAEQAAEQVMFAILKGEVAIMAGEPSRRNG